jgi:arylsulfatase A
MLHPCSLAFVFLIPLATDARAQAAPPTGEAESDESAPPNVVLIYTDDQGYADIGVYGAQGFETPNLDRLASEGLRLDSFYVSQATCTSSRASIRTGCYANRIGVMGALGPKSSHGFHEDEETLAELLRERGYATSFVGKWHTGDLPAFLPTRHGYDEWFGLPYSNDMWPVDYDGEPVPAGHHKTSYPPLPLMEGDEVVEIVGDLEAQSKLTRRYTDRAIAFIEREAPNGPFFLELAHSMPHVPLGTSKPFRDQADYGPYGDVIEEIDATVGELLATLDRVGVAERTLVIFTSDNGPWLNYGDHAGSAEPFREGKGTMWEGGCRVPCIMRFPGVIPAGSSSSELTATIDLLPTIAAACGARQPRLAIDGVNLLAHLSDPSTPSPRTDYWYYYYRELQAVREGRWKLHLPHAYRSYEGQPVGENGHPGKTRQRRVGIALYDLLEDPGERHDLADAHPEVVTRLRKIVAEALADLGDHDLAGPGRREPGRE